MTRRTYFGLLLTVLLAGVAIDGMGQSLRFLALGDSYTIGEAVDREENWPHQLKAALDSKGFATEVDIIAKTGWRCDELIEALRNHRPSDYDVVSILIGVNNQFQARPIGAFSKDLDTLITLALAKVGNDSTRIFFVSIPDYSFTPFAATLNNPNISIELDRYNAILERAAANLDAPFIYITPISREFDDALVAEDDLHPSAFQYSLWVERIMAKLEHRWKGWAE